MTTKVVSVRDLAREGKKIAEYDFVDVMDKKTNQYRGVFVSFRHADEVKEFFKKKRQKKLDRIMKLSGMATGLFGDETVQSIKSKQG